MKYFEQKAINTIVLTFFFKLAQSESDSASVESIYEAMNTRIGFQRLQIALETLERMDALRELFSVDGSTPYVITDVGYAKAEELYLNKKSAVYHMVENGFDWYFEVLEKRSDTDKDQEVPASDRFVTVSDNMPGYDQVTSTIEAANEDIRGSNHLNAEEKSWIRVHLNIGLELLKKGGKVLVSAINSLIIEPLEAALKESSEEKIKKALKAAIAAAKTYFGL